MSGESHDLDALTRALREEHGVDASSDGTLGRHRLERSLREEGKAKRRRVSFLVLLAATFVGLTAWASSTGRLPRAIRYLEALASSDEETSPPVISPAPPSLAPSPSASAANPESPSASPPDPAPALAPAPVRAPSRAPSSLSAAPPPPPSPSPSPVTPDADALYRDAHSAHFDRKDYASALSAWDRYLAAAGPAGRFTVEARYNRAIALLRLGRRDEARTALEPFARGEYGGYRRDDATRLVDSLR